MDKYDLDQDVAELNSIDEVVAYEQAKKGEGGFWEGLKTAVIYTGTAGGVAVVAGGIGYGVYKAVK